MLFTDVPKVRVSTEGSTISSQVHLKILNPYSSEDQEYVAAVLECEALGELSFAVRTKESELTARIDTLHLTVTNIKTFFFTTVDLQ